MLISNFKLLLVILLILFIIFIILAIYLFKYLYSNSSSSIQYVSNRYMKNIVNKSIYFDKMSRLDLIARKSGSSEDYKRKYYNSLIAFNNADKSKLEKCIKNIDLKIKKYKNLYAIDWKFAKVSDDIELGYPHTLEDTIVLSPKFLETPEDQMMITLLHEKIHIYQRRYPLETEELILNILNYKIKSVNSDILELARNNPDINNLNYGKDDYVILQIYNNFSPKNISDSRLVKVINKEIQDYTHDASMHDASMHDASMHVQYEHPYEIMACYLPHIIYKNKNQINHEILEKTVNWIDNYL